jgi:hypothetical protein
MHLKTTTPYRAAQAAAKINAKTLTTNVTNINHQYNTTTQVKIKIIYP